jgi:hypothetical protein
MHAGEQQLGNRCDMHCSCLGLVLSNPAAAALPGQSSHANARLSVKLTSFLVAAQLCSFLSPFLSAGLQIQ